MTAVPPASRPWRRAPVGALVLVAAGLALAGLILASSLLDYFPRRRVDAGAVHAALLFYGAALGGAWAVWRAWPRRWREILLGAGALAVALGFAEFALRLMLPTRGYGEYRGLSSRRYHHVPPPSARACELDFEKEPVFIRTNGDGLRTEWTRRSFRRHSPRVAVMGDSFVWGYAMAQEAALPAALERELRARGQEDAAVLNAGVISYSPFLARIFFEGVVRHYEPEVVVYVLDASDFYDDLTYEYLQLPEAEGGGFPVADGRATPWRGALWQSLGGARAWLTGAAAYPFGGVERALFPAPAPPRLSDERRATMVADPFIYDRYFIFKHPPEGTGPRLRATLDNIRALAADVRAAGARFMLVVAPRYFHWSDRECPFNWELRDYRPDEPWRSAYLDYFEQARVEVDFPVLSLLSAFQAAGEFPLVFKEDPHWTAAGHAVAARAVAAGIENAK